MASKAASLPPELRAHQQWLGFAQPVGLVVSLPALEKAQCYVNRNTQAPQQALRSIATGPSPDDPPDSVADLRELCTRVLGWKDRDLVEPPDDLAVAVPEHGETLRPTFVVPGTMSTVGVPAEPSAGQPKAWMALVSVVLTGTDLDKERKDTAWPASPQTRFERLLRESGVPIGLLFNGHALRLVYAPRGESSGHVTFSVASMAEVAGRPILAGMVALLSEETMFSLPEPQRLPTLLRDSRRYQSEVSNRLSEQVLDALRELLAGFQVADDAAGGRLLREALEHAPEEVYGGLLATLLRLVFLLYAEDRGLMGQHEVYLRHYAVAGLFEKLREEQARFVDTMDQRYGAWAQLLTLFRLVHDGATHARFELPGRQGRLFDPDAYPFLEGRPWRTARQTGERLAVPKVSDGVVFRVLENLLWLDGERLSYRTLDVEQIGSVYEAVMGFTVERTLEPSVALRPYGVVLGLDTLLAAKGADRLKALADGADCKVTGKAQEAVRAARSRDELVAALGKSLLDTRTGVHAAGVIVLQPTEERRRSGSHYTPRALTEPIVEKTLRPVIEALGPAPTPEALLSLKVCDLAMGSGAFLVAACRFLADQLVTAWQKHGTPPIPSDEDTVLFARRQVAQRCLYGVDKNPFAVDLGKLSLWLVTLAKNHPFTFLDHALRQGDSLVGLTREQIASFHWRPEKQVPTLRQALDEAVGESIALRSKIHALSASDDTSEKRHLLRDADDALVQVRRAAHLVLEAYFGEEKDKARLQRLKELAGHVATGLTSLPACPAAEAHTPFHWEIEFPEVFIRSRPGFDAILGNPPFLGGKRISTNFGDSYTSWLAALHEGTSSNVDIVGHFYRRAFDLLRAGGTFGLIATNTIAQGDTRSGGLRWILQHGGVIYDATKRYRWPGLAAVVVSVVHVTRAPSPSLVFVARLEGKPANRVSAFLFHQGGDDDPARLRANENKSFQGSILVGLGFTFDDTTAEATSLAEMRRLIEEDPRNRDRIFPYLGGEELNTSPTQSPHRHTINFEQMTEAEAGQWPELLAILARKVRPVRAGVKRDAHRDRWWQYGDYRPGLYSTIRPLQRVLANSQVSAQHSLAFQPTDRVFSHALNIFAFDSFAAFAALQARPHELWARFLGSTLEDRLRYTPSDCFETFPFPRDWEGDGRLEEAGRVYHEFRAKLMADEATRADLMAGTEPEGLTATYNRFHDPDETLPGILELRRLHAAMDRAVLDAYGWTDLDTTCQFLLDYEEDEGEEGGGRASKKKPWRYRWPDEVRDEVLARLLALNAERAAEERLLGEEARLASPPAPKKAPAKKRAAKKDGGDGSGDLFS